MRIISARAFSYCLGKKFCIITVSIILWVTANIQEKQIIEKPAAAKSRAFDKEGFVSIIASVTKNKRQSKSGFSRFSHKRCIHKRYTLVKHCTRHDFPFVDGNRC